MFNMLLEASQSISAPIRHSRYCANDMMLYAESAILDQNLHHLCNPQLMGQDGKVQSWEEQHVNLHFRLANCRLRSFGTLNGTRWCSWRSGLRWRRNWYPISALDWWKSTHTIAPPLCQGIPSCASVARKTAVGVVLTNESRDSFHLSLHLFTRRKLNPHCLLSSDFGPRFLD
jgi:hypothetical protein